MKVKTLPRFILISLTLGFNACNQGSQKQAEKTPNSDSLNAVKYKPSVAAIDLLKAFNDLSSVTTPPCPTGEFPSIVSIMPDKYYGGTKVTKGNINFVVYKYMDATKYDTHIFRVIWDSTAEGYKYYGVCPPSPKITFDINDIYSNDVYEAMLIPIKAYRTYRRTHTVPLYPASEYEELYTYAQTHKKFALDVTQILSISSPLYEPSIGFMAKYNNYRYTYNFSSIGIVVMVKTKIDIGNATDIEITIPCYVVNNYDCDGTLIWKE